MTIAQDLSLFFLISNASFLVQIVMILLLIMSLLSWWYIFRKSFVIRKAIKKTKQFEIAFWRGTDLGTLYKSSEDKNKSSIEKIFESGLLEYGKLRKQPELSAESMIEGTRRAMKATYQREIDELEYSLSFMATVGSISPYIGLFGTVWGIMNAFRGLATVGQATLTQVAPGIAEALIATAMGLFAAIPAVMAYNHFVRHLERLGIRFDNFIEEFSNFLQRQTLTSEK